MAMASVRERLVSRRTARRAVLGRPASRGRRAVRRPTPSPRAAGATHMRLISAGSSAVELQPAARHRLAAQRRDAGTRRRAAHLVGARAGRPSVRVEARCRSGDRARRSTRRGSGARMVVAGVDDLDSTSAAVRSRSTSAMASTRRRRLRVGERVEQRPGEVVAAPVELGPLAPTLAA